MVMILVIRTGRTSEAYPTLNKHNPANKFLKNFLKNPHTAGLLFVKLIFSAIFNVVTKYKIYIVVIIKV